MESKKYLEQVKKIDFLINNKLKEKEQVYSMATSITATMTGMPHGTGVSDKIGDCTSRLVDLEHEIDELIDKYVDIKSEVIKTIEKLSATEYNVIFKYYIEYKTQEQIAEETGYGERHIRRLLNDGLEHLEYFLLCP